MARINKKNQGVLQGNPPAEGSANIGKSSDNIQDVANALMQSSRVEEIYRTSDGYWFTNSVNADDNARKLGEEKQVFTLKK